MKRRITSEEERKLFEADYRAARPIKAVTPKKTVKKKTALSGASGINGATQARLKKGALEPDARIDLHGFREADAHAALLAFLSGAQRRGHRLVLVITGKGNPKKDESADWMASAHGVLKQMVPRWLREPDFAALIASSQTAHARHGGGGALYVYLRKNR